MDSPAPDPLHYASSWTGTITANPPPKPLIVFDGDCGFCRRWARRWQERTGDAVDYEPLQCAAERFPDVGREHFEHATTLIEPDGRVYSGAQAVFRALAAGGYRPWLQTAYEKARPFAAVSDLCYRVISNHRGRADSIDRFLFGKQTAPPTYILTRWLFLRLIGVIYLIAFTSLFVQIDGLIGSKGILPIQPYLQSLEQNYGNRVHALLPTLLWFSASDRALHGLCIAGIVLSVLLIIGLLPAAVLIALWALYLSMVCGGQIFLGYQWDALLIEAGFLGIFFAPMELLLWRAPRRPPSALAILLLRWLLFRVMFLSGVVKLSSGDPNWRNWTALTYHYFTQPLPAWTSWYFQQLPLAFQKFSVGFTFFAELLAPVLIFGPRRLRSMAFWIIVLLQLLILVSGNFGFFNVLTIALCLTLREDSSWPHWLRHHFASRHRQASRWWPLPFVLPLCVVVFSITTMQILSASGATTTWPASVAWIYEQVRPYDSVNSYGLFAIMTTTRPEIIVEGSDDGENWKEYGFNWKPVELNHPPQFCAPHMPRLDWQLWFAALQHTDGSRADIRENPWALNFMIRLLQGEPAVLDLMGKNPFPDHPPRYVRAVLYQYEFTNWQERKATGNWWKRQVQALYCPAVSLNDVR